MVLPTCRLGHMRHMRLRIFNDSFFLLLSMISVVVLRANNAAGPPSSS